MTDEEVIKIIDCCFKIHDYELLAIEDVVKKLKNAMPDADENLIRIEVIKRMP